MDIAYPFQIRHGQTLLVDYNDHIRQMIEQLLFTIPGERVNRPDFGTGLQRLVFEPGGAEMIAAQEQLIHAALQRWLGSLIEIESFSTRVVESTLYIHLVYTVRRTGERRTEELVR